MIKAAGTWRPVSTGTNSLRILRLVGRVLTYFLLWLGAAVMLFPFAWMMSLSLGSMKDLWTIPPRYIPEEPNLNNYATALFTFPFLRYVRNTLVITGANLAGQVLSCTAAAYSFARLRWKGRNLVFILMLGTMMMPPQVTLIPMYVIWRKLGALDTYIPLIVPGYLGTAYLTFLARQYFASIPLELEDAARVDGCGFFSTYFRIMLPLAVPLMVTLGLFSFVGHWNDFFGPLIYLTTPDKYTIQLGMMSFRGQYQTDVPAMMAASVMVLMPTLLIFLFGQQYFIRSVVLSGLKG
jgi:ABC-type glycerol-3-phosphate transport system permease component